MVQLAEGVIGEMLVAVAGGRVIQTRGWYYQRAPWCGASAARGSAGRHGSP